MALARAEQLAKSKHRLYNHIRRVMRHQKKTIKLGRTAEHRKALLANQVCSLIEHQRIKTTLAKAKAVRPLAEHMVTLGKNGSIHARRTALAKLRQKSARAPRILTRDEGCAAQRGGRSGAQIVRVPDWGGAYDQTSRLPPRYVHAGIRCHGQLGTVPSSSVALR